MTFYNSFQILKKTLTAKKQKYGENVKILHNFNKSIESDRKKVYNSFFHIHAAIVKLQFSTMCMNSISQYFHISIKKPHSNSVVYYVNKKMLFLMKHKIGRIGRRSII